MVLKKVYKQIFAKNIMEHFLKSIFNGKKSEDIHSEFIKFGRGRYENKYLIYGKKQKDKWSIKTSAEFANYLVKKCLLKTPENIHFRGIIISTFDLTKEIDFEIENVKKYMGIQQVVINGNVEKSKLIRLMEKYPRFFYGLSFTTKDFELKVKAKAPKNGKPVASGEKQAVPNFCSLKTSDKSIIEDLFFDYPNFEEINVKHTILIEEVILPRGITDPVQIREKSERKGKIIRKTIVNGKELEKETSFVA